MYSFTLFTSIFDNKTDKTMSFSSLEKFEKLLFDLAKQPGYKPKKDERDKKGSPLISPARFQEKTTRSNASVIHWDRWAALDVDEYTGSFDSAVSTFKDRYFICYSSASSTKEKTKFRVILPLTEAVPAARIRHFWYALNTEFNSLGDKQTKDLSRMYYVPAQYPGANNFIFKHRGGPLLDPDEIMSRHAYVDPNEERNSKISPEIREAMEKYRRETLTNTSIRWSSYHDCPFVNKRLVSEYRSISSTGWYAKMYSIMMSIASNAIKKCYPITAEEIASLCSEIDRDTGGWYKNRPLKVEAARALGFALKS